MDCIFGALPITPEEIVKQLQTLANQLEVGASFKERTTAINGLLHKLGEERGHELYYKRLPDYAEFLLDFVWSEKAIGKERSVLAVEAEWGSPVHHQNEDLDKIAAEVEGRGGVFETPMLQDPAQSDGLHV